MTIACLGWGSLIWDPRDLPIQRCWFQDGPLLPIEFARQSRDDRITPVIVPGARDVRCLWSPMLVTDIDTARAQLAAREGMAQGSVARHIGYWTTAGAGHGQAVDTIGRWAATLHLDGVVWTNLPPRFEQIERVPTVEEVISFLRARPAPAQQRAEEYVRKTPRQIDTAYRRRIEAELQWPPLGTP